MAIMGMAIGACLLFLGGVTGLDPHPEVCVGAPTSSRWMTLSPPAGR